MITEKLKIKTRRVAILAITVAVLAGCMNGKYVKISAEEFKSTQAEIEALKAQNAQLIADKAATEEKLKKSEIEKKSQIQQQQKATAKVVSIKQKKTYKVGDIIEFGSYPYYENGGEKPIEWQILEKYNDGTALVISKYALDNVKYNETYTDVTWETSSIRKWLNNDFYNKAFRNANKDLIIESHIESKDHSGKWSDRSNWHTKGGNTTYDKMFLLSIEEAEKYFSSDEKRKLQPTPYAKSINSKNGNLWTVRDGSCWWWLRSPGCHQNVAAAVGIGGLVQSFGFNVGSNEGAVRPAMKINLKKL